MRRTVKTDVGQRKMMKESEKNVGLKVKAVSWLCVWALAFLLCIIPPTRTASIALILDPMTLLLGILFFPLGLGLLIARVLHIDGDDWMPISMWIGWIFYLGITISICFVKSRKYFLWILGILVAILLCNVGGW
jgi:hypothetical protein